MAERLIAVALGLTVPAAQGLVPKVTYLVGVDPAKANRLAYQILAFFLIGALGAVACTMLLADWAVPLVFGKGFQSSITVLKVFVLVLPLSVINQVLGLYFLIPRHREGLRSRWRGVRDRQYRRRDSARQPLGGRWAWWPRGCWEK